MEYELTSNQEQTLLGLLLIRQSQLSFNEKGNIIFQHDDGTTYFNQSEGICYIMVSGNWTKLSAEVQ